MSRTPIPKEVIAFEDSVITKTVERIWDLADVATMLLVAARSFVPFETQTDQVMQQIMQQIKFKKV